MSCQDCEQLKEELLLQKAFAKDGFRQFGDANRKFVVARNAIRAAVAVMTTPRNLPYDCDLAAGDQDRALKLLKDALAEIGGGP